MPLLYEPATGTESETFASADGVVTAVTDPAKAGVLLRVQATGAWCTVWRTDPTGRTLRVRSGDPCLLVNGEGHAYDHELRPGVAYAYHVERADGTVSQAVAVTVPVVSSAAWLKSPIDPSSSLQVRTRGLFPLPSDRQTGVVQVIGARHRFVTTSARMSPIFRLTIRTTNAQDASRLQRLLDADGPVLWHPLAGLGPDRWLVVVRDTEEGVATDPADPRRDWVLEVLEVDRPVTNGAPLLMPGWAWRDASAPFASMAELTAAYPSMWDLLLAGIT